MTVPELISLLPEGLLLVAAMLCLVLGRGSVPPRVGPVVNLTAIVGAGCLLALGPNVPTAQTATVFVHDSFAAAVRGTALALASAFLLIAWRDLQSSMAACGLMLMSTAGLMLAGRVNDLFHLYLSAELVVIPSLILLALSARTRRRLPQEAGGEGDGPLAPLLAELWGSLLASLILVYGLVLLAGVGGETELSAIRDALASEITPDASSASAASPFPLGTLAVVLITAGAGWRMGLMPFQLNQPGLANATRAWEFAWIALLQRFTGFVILVRVVLAAMPGYEATAALLLAIVAAVTLATAGVMLWRRDRLRERLACLGSLYAAVATAGLAAACANAGEPGTVRAGLALGLPAAMLVLAADALALTGLVAGLTWLRGAGREIDYAEELAGLLRTQPLAGAGLAVCLLSLAGLPLFAGFWGRLLVLASLVSVPADSHVPDTPAHHPALLLLAVLVVAAMLAAAAILMRLLAAVVIDRPISIHRPVGGPAPLVPLGMAAALLLMVGVLPGAVIRSLGEWETKSQSFNAAELSGGQGRDGSSETGDPQPGESRPRHEATVPSEARRQTAG